MDKLVQFSHCPFKKKVSCVCTRIQPKCQSVTCKSTQKTGGGIGAFLATRASNFCPSVYRGQPRYVSVDFTLVGRVQWYLSFEFTGSVQDEFNTLDSVEFHFPAGNTRLLSRLMLPLAVEQGTRRVSSWVKKLLQLVLIKICILQSTLTLADKKQRTNLTLADFLGGQTYFYIVNYVK